MSKLIYHHPKKESPQEDFGEKYAYTTIEEFESIVGYKVNEAFKFGFQMARLKNKHLGFVENPESIEK